MKEDNFNIIFSLSAGPVILGFKCNEQTIKQTFVSERLNA